MVGGNDDGVGSELIGFDGFKRLVEMKDGDERLVEMVVADVEVMGDRG